jgi:ribonuclease D
MSEGGSPLWIDSKKTLHDLAAKLVDEPLYALDTEFHRERSYFPRLALVQLAWSGGVAVVDPLAVDVAPLRALLEGPGLAVCHAAEQDLEVLQRACGAVPARLFDTQIAAAFLGLGFASLARLALAVVNKKIPKGDRLTDWTRRPLDPAQIAYAAADVEHLIPIHHELLGRAGEAGVATWVEEECERLRTRQIGPIDPDTAWWRIKGSRALRGPQRGVAQQVAGWRERRAMEKDLPPRFVLPDLALAGIVQRPPRSREELRGVRGLDGRYLKSGGETEILAAVDAGREMDPHLVKRPPSGEPNDEHLGPSVALGLALVAQLAAERGIEPTLLANRADCGARGRPPNRPALFGLALGARGGIAARPVRGRGGAHRGRQGGSRPRGAGHGAPAEPAPARNRATRGAGRSGRRSSRDLISAPRRLRRRRRERCFPRDPCLAERSSGSSRRRLI